MDCNGLCPGAVHPPCFGLFSSRVSKIQQRLGPQVRGPQLSQLLPTSGTSLISMDCTKDLHMRLANGGFLECGYPKMDGL